MDGEYEYGYDIGARKKGERKWRRKSAESYMGGSFFLAHSFGPFRGRRTWPPETGDDAMNIYHLHECWGILLPCSPAMSFRTAFARLRPPPLLPTTIRTIQILATLHLVSTTLAELRICTGFSMLPTLSQHGDCVLVSPLPYWSPLSEKHKSAGPKEVMLLSLLLRCTLVKLSANVFWVLRAI